jgi:thioredoxin reductase (NADPH)
MYKCHAVIIATGVSERKLGVPGEEKYYGKGVSYCAVCDGALYKDKVMAVIGNGNHAIEETLFLEKFAKKIYLISSENSLSAEKKLVDQIINNDSIELINNCSLISISGDEFVNGIIVDRGNGKEKIMVSAVFPFLGEEIDTRFAEKLKIVDDKKRIVVNEKKETIIKGIYAAGDCTNTLLRQIVTASGDGAVCATEAYKYIKNKK